MVPEDLLTNEIIERSLQSDLNEEVEIVSWTHESCAEIGGNFFNVVKRLHVRYVKKNTGTKNEASYFAKLNPCKGNNDAFNPYRQRAMTKEIFFYQTLLPLLNSELEKLGREPLNVPRYLYSSNDPEREVIVLEDLSVKGFKTLPRGTAMDEKHSRIMAKEIGKLHAASFVLQTRLAESNQELAHVFPLLVESWIVQDDPKLREAFEKVFAKGVKLDINLVKATPGFEDVVQWIQENLIGKEMNLLLKELESVDPWKGLCHGDYHRSNVLFKYKEEGVPTEVMIIDWQTVRVANIASEINYLLYSSYFGSPRKQYFPVIAESYFESLNSNKGPKVVVSFSLEELEAEVTKNSFGLLICFYLFPMSLCVDDPSDLFRIDGDQVEMPQEDALKIAKDLLKSKPNLSFVMSDYLQEIQKFIK